MGSRTKIPKIRLEIFRSASTPREDVKHTSRGQPAVGSGCFLRDRSGNYKDKP